MAEEKAMEYDPHKAEWVECTDEFKIAEHEAAAASRPAPGDRTEEELRAIDNPGLAGPVLTSNENVVGGAAVSDEAPTVRERRAAKADREEGKADGGS